MAYLIPLGAIVTVVGLVLLMVCILRVAKARKAGLPEEELRAVLEATVPMNLGALFLSALGLMMVVVGILLG
ncbi:hypothetical protein [uncultured Litoreibacter sp.]|uniref:hypothetical protein n=1 Tax=uncultured Litoreibacter sp. TaxID=1392394 RepID=UPI002621AB82|nr:hypothetical protein [uncultured Litoreibacter sp.]